MLLNIVTNTTAMHTIGGQFIPYIDGPLREWILSNIQSTLFLRQHDVMPSGNFTCINLENEYYNQYFNNHVIS